MRRIALALAAGVLAQAALLAVVSGMPHHHPTAGTLAFRVASVGVVGGFVAATAAGRAPLRAGAATGSVAGLGVGAGFWWLVFHGDTVGVFHHLHYALVTTPALVDLIAGAPRLGVAGVSLVVAFAFAASGALGGYAVSRRP
ncbi:MULTISPECIES: hypothetical protein [Halobacterium]|uniref:hypothetical protein n=1 Tax=Halobacterium TaxID=2239 RepID=UPI00073E3D12|nr:MULTISPECIES: hypothetical protein [Halobacterium]MCG1002710.1 hypothetical protein [Halobacterium noricense]